MIGDVGVIRTFTKSWPKDSPRRYYIDDYWKEKEDIKEALPLYYRRNRIDADDRKNQIHVFFDENGVLKITQCNDPELRSKIVRYVENLYNWELHNNRDIDLCGYSVQMLIEPYRHPLKNDFVQIRYRGMFVNLSPQQLSEIMNSTATFFRTPTSMVMEYDSGIPKFNEIIRSMVSRGDIFPLRIDAASAAPEFPSSISPL